MPRRGRSRTRDRAGLKRLGKLLALNHLHLTLPDEFRDSQPVLVDPSFLAHERERRIVVVVGAGASMAAGLPGTPDAIEAINSRIAKMVSEELLTEELDRLKLEYRLVPEEFETFLLAVSRFNRNAVVGTLEQLFKKNYGPTLTYEVLAHLLKHRFIDAVINFNFDELLDQSIEDEIGKGNYLRIVSDGDCPLDHYELRWPMPVYIKPHGTVSHRSTMRFTRGDYLLLPTAIHDLIETLLSGMPVTLIVIGFNMQSFEFNEIVMRSMQSSDCAIYNFTLEPLPHPPPDQRILDLYAAGAHISVQPDLDTQIRELWRQVEGQFNEAFRPRGIARHDLICSLFKPCSRPKHVYLRNRAVVELALATAKAKGFVNTRVLSNGRTGKYFQLWREAGRPRKTLYDMCRELGLRTCSYSREALRLPGPKGAVPQPRVMKGDEFKDHGMPSLCTAVARHLTNCPLPPDSDERRLMETALWAMFERDEVEVVHTHSAVRYELCTDPYPLDTLTALKACTAQALSDPDWDTLLCVAETGEWLTKENILQCLKLQPGRRIALIVADETHMAEVVEQLQGLAVVEHKKLDWWLHNKHMTLFVESNTRTVRKGFFFERRLRSPRIAPVMVEGSDAQELLTVFFAYWCKAAPTLRVDREGRQTRAISSKDVENALTAFFERPAPTVEIVQRSKGSIAAPPSGQSASRRDGSAGEH